MAWKVTLIWKFDTQGWTESWYYDSASPASSTLEQAFINFAQARNGLNGKGSQLQAIRYTEVGVPRAVFYVNIGNIAFATATQAIEQANASYFAEASPQGGGSIRQVWLRGIPDDWVVFDPAKGTWNPVGNLTRAFRTFTGIVLNSTWKYQTVAKLNTGGTFTTPVSALASVGGVPQLTVGAVGWAATDAIVVSGFSKPLSYLNGTYGPKRWSANALTIKLKRTLSTDLAALYVTGASIRKRVTSLTAVSSFNLQEPGTRRTGRQLFARRGRRPARV